MVARRLLLLFALLMLMAALAAQVTPEPQPLDEPDGPPPAAVAGGEPKLIEKTLQAGGSGRALVEAAVGDTVRLTVESDALATVEIQGLDRLEPTPPEAPARFEIYAAREGAFPLVLVESGREFARLSVSR